MKSDKAYKNTSTLSTTLSLGYFLASRQLRRTSFWTTGLIVFIMTLTFLNLVVINGILVGLIVGSSNAYRAQYSADILIASRTEKVHIEKTQQITSIIETLPDVVSYTPRYLVGGKIQSDYKKTRKPDILADEAGAQVAGIDPEKEDAVTGLSHLLKFGEYLTEKDTDSILIGKSLLSQYSQGDFAGTGTVDGVQVGSRVLLKIGDVTHEVTVKGVLGSKIDTVDRRIFMTSRELVRLIGRDEANADEIAVKIRPGVTPEKVKADLVKSGVSQWALVQTWEESQGSFFKQITQTFSALGSMIGLIGLAVASITIFIVIFINAVTRKRYIGILKGIGIRPAAIEFSYILISLFYATVGTLIGLGLLYFFLKPFFDVHPIDFPFSDGILVAEPLETGIRVLLIMITTIIAGYIPARNIIKKNTLDSILGR
ncbi:MAG: FtsX-like permease family protein [Patescibacteria group bacterium]